MITARGLTKRFGPLLAVDGADFDVPAGGVTGFLGPNGAGKTTTIRMMTGYLRPTSGRVLIDGHDATEDSRIVRQHLGYLQESSPLYGEMRVDEYLRFRARLFGITRRERATAIDRSVEACSLESVRRRPIQQLSKGFRQRVGLASALLHGPSVLILDEPTEGLDPTQIREVRHLIRGLADEHTVLLSTHILPEAEVVCDRLIVIAGGRIQAEGSLDTLRSAGGRRYVLETDTANAAALLDAMPGVASVQTQTLDTPWSRLVITAAPDAADLREPLGARIKAADGTVRELRREAPSLEHLFVRLTSGDGDGPASAVASSSSPAPPSAARDEVAV